MNDDGAVKCTRCERFVMARAKEDDMPTVLLDDGDHERPAVSYVLCLECQRDLRAWVMGMDR